MNEETQNFCDIEFIGMRLKFNKICYSDVCNTWQHFFLTELLCQLKFNLQSIDSVKFIHLVLIHKKTFSHCTLQEKQIQFIYQHTYTVSSIKSTDSKLVTYMLQNNCSFKCSQLQFIMPKGKKLSIDGNPVPIIFPAIPPDRANSNSGQLFACSNS